MKNHEIDALVRYRLEQADAALADARFLLEGNRSPQSIVNRAYYAMFYAALALLQKVGKVPSKHAGPLASLTPSSFRRASFPASSPRTSTKRWSSAKFVCAIPQGLGVTRSPGRPALGIWASRVGERGVR